MTKFELLNELAMELEARRRLWSVSTNEKGEATVCTHRIYVKRYNCLHHIYKCLQDMPYDEFREYLKPTDSLFSATDPEL